MRSIDYDKLRVLTNCQIAKYFCELTEAFPVLEITEELLDAIEEGYVPAYLASIWLSVTKSPEVAKLAIEQQHSVLTRRAGLRYLGWLFKHTDGSKVLESIGGNSKIVSLFEALSVEDVGTFSRALSSPMDESSLKANSYWVDGICQALLDKSGPEMRPLSDLYVAMLPACSATFIEGVIDRGISVAKGTMRKLLIQHPTLFRKKILSSLHSGKPFPDYTDNLLHRLPHGVRDGCGLTPSMEFSMDVLHSVSSVDNLVLKVGDEFIIDRVLEPLVRRVYRNHGKDDKYGVMSKVIPDLINIISRKPKTAKRVQFTRQKLGWFLVQFWTRSTSKYEATLCSLINAQNYEFEQILNTFKDCFETIPVHYRFKLLNLILLCKSTDVYSVESLEKSPVRRWPRWIFQVLPREESRGLLSRLIEGSNQCFLSRPLRRTYEEGRGDLCDFAVGDNDTDQDFLATILERGGTGALQKATSAAKVQKLKAETARDHTNRTTHALGALYYSISSGSLELLLDTIKWMKRYLKDPLVMPELVSGDFLQRTETIDMLVGLPRFRLCHGLACRDFKNKVGHAVEEAVANATLINEIIRTLFSYACSAVREPFFQSYHWRSVLDLPAQIAMLRIDRIESLPDMDPGSAVKLLAATRDLLVELESKALSIPDEKLNYAQDTCLGLLKRYPLPEKRAAHPATLKFIDTLAKARDEIWRNFRLKKDPEISSLSTQYLYGLPLIKHLQPFNRITSQTLDVGLENTSEQLPYIVSRAKEIVLMPADIALAIFPRNQDLIDAILPFFDCYGLALRAYILSHDPHSRSKAIKEAWAHALENLSSPGTHSDKAREEWGIVFEGALGDLATRVLGSALKHDPFLQLPGVETQTATIDWDPLHACQPYTCEIDFPLTSIEWFNNAYISFSRGEVRSHLKNSPSPGRPPKRPRGFTSPIWYKINDISWSLENDANIGSAILYLAAQCECSQKMLERPFPTTEHVRFPAMTLSASFLSRKDISTNMAGNILAELLAMVPAALLERLTKIVLQSLSATSPDSQFLADNEERAFILLKLLMRSDSPALALPLLVDTILKYPDASSWHRQLLSSRMLRRLSAKEAENLMIHFSDKILSALDVQQSKPKDQPPLSAGSSPFVKVTTVKFLAELLRGSSFLTPYQSVEILFRLVKSAKHIDIRVAGLKCLLETLNTCKEPTSKPLAETIVTFLEYLTTEAGAFNERYPLTNEEWEEAETTLCLPTPFSDNESPPIMRELFWEGISGLPKNCILTKKEYFQRILLPMTESSRASNRRWLHIFCRKYDAEDLMKILPILPVDHQYPFESLLKELLPYVPQEWINLLHEYFLFNLSPPSSVRALNSKISSNKDFKRGPDRYWLRHYKDTPECHLLHLLADELPSKSPNGITLGMVQTLVVEEIKAVIGMFDSHTALWNEIVNNLGRTGQDRPQKKRWARQKKPVIELVIKHLESLRNTEWIENPHRRPASLPSAYSLHFSLIEFPQSSSENCEEAKKQCKTTAEALRDFIILQVIGSSGTPYHNKFGILKQQSTRKITGMNCCLVAVFLGDSMDLARPKLADYLCLELADEILRSARKTLTSGKPMKEVAGMIQEWIQSEDEYIRDYGLKWSRERGMSWLKSPMAAK